MGEEPDDDLEALRSDQPSVQDDDLDGRASADSDALLSALETLTLEPIPWFDQAEIVATIETAPRPLRTRDAVAAEELLDIVLLADAPDWMDPQVNVRARGDIVEIEVEVDEPVGRLWSTIDVLGEPVGTAMVADPADPRLRVARLPLALVAGHIVHVLLHTPT